jgi:hypothetical protein
VTVLFETEDGGIYDLEKSPDGLDNFAPVEGQTDLPGDGGEIEAYDEFATEPKAFYRVVRQP